MRFLSSLLVAVVTACVFSSELPAQNEKTLVMHAAALFIKDSLPPGPVLLDLDGVASTSTDADNTARALNAARGNAQTAITCTPLEKGRKPPQSCSIAGNQVLVEIQAPFVLGDKAQTTVKYTYEYKPGYVGYVAWELQLVRNSNTNATWRVSKVLAKARS